MAEHEVSISPKAAQETGALDGWECRCTCGLVWGTSLSRSWAEGEAQRHAEWHARVSCQRAS